MPTGTATISIVSPRSAQARFDVPIDYNIIIFKLFSVFEDRPLYAQIERRIENLIRRDHQPGDLLPTQARLAREFGVSLITIRRAIDELGRRGWVEPIAGRGTVVRQPTVSDFHGGVSSWTDSIAGSGLIPATAWTRITVRRPPPRIARLLGLPARRKTVLIERLRTADGHPICLMTNELNAALVPGLAERGLDRESLYACLAEWYGLHPSHADEEVSARPATPQERRLLNIRAPTLLSIRRITMLDNGQPMEVADVLAPADRYQYRVRIHAGAKGPAARQPSPPQALSNPDHLQSVAQQENP